MLCTCEMDNLVVVLGDLVFENEWVIQGWTPLLNEGGFNSPTLQRGVESLHGQNYKLNFSLACIQWMASSALTGCFFSTGLSFRIRAS